MTQRQIDTIRCLRKDLYEKELHIKNLKVRLLQAEAKLENLHLLNDKLFADRNAFMTVAFIFGVSTIALSLALWRF